jgi:hypothetical protein
MGLLCMRQQSIQPSLGVAQRAMNIDFVMTHLELTFLELIFIVGIEY